MSAIEGFWAVVPAGGAGTRLWPLSRAATPKFLLDLTGSGRTLLQATVDRLRPLCGSNVVVVTGEAHRRAVVSQLSDPGPSPQVLAEPSPRDSMAAIGWAAAVLEAEHPDAVIGSFAADHVIGDRAAYERCVREAVEVARTGRLVTIGIEPTYAATGFGYVRGAGALADFPTARQVTEFVEKPDEVTAGGYVASGEFRWNAGMFVVRASVLLDLLGRRHPEFAARLRALAARPDRLEELWPSLSRITIDHAVAEPSAAEGAVAMVPGTFAWDDLGDFASLRRLLPPSAEGPAVLGDATLVTAVDASGLVVPTGGRRVAVVGLDDVVVVDTPDAVLVTSLARAQDVKAIVEALKAEGRTDLT